MRFLAAFFLILSATLGLAETNSIDWRNGAPGIRVVTNAPSYAVFTNAVASLSNQTVLVNERVDNLVLEGATVDEVARAAAAYAYSPTNLPTPAAIGAAPADHPLFASVTNLNLHAFLGENGWWSLVVVTNLYGQ